MKAYTYSQAREKLSAILDESKTDEVVIKRRKGDLFTIIPKTPEGRSPFEVECLGKNISRNEIIDIIRQSRERA
jgi:hypothetical protein